MRAYKIYEDIYVSLKDICDYLEVDYDEALEIAKGKLKNYLDVCEYCYVNEEFCVCYAGAFTMFNKSNVDKSKLNVLLDNWREY